MSIFRYLIFFLFFRSLENIEEIDKNIKKKVKIKKEV